MRKVLYLNNLADGATDVSVYTGEVGEGRLVEYGVRSPELVDRIRKYAEKHCSHEQFTNSVYGITDVYELEEAEGD